ncbi:MAG: TM0106 family RecB-like putative nuclease [Candidatus Viridilinea halotolerans]|uniref:TM0106 family RecB-like putative nuclease n=1 Tax=Candidatus Viridilinea halotolerans TaxID=2491704 RepID=A0A426U2Y6_9CHLR|nr:MAG: TM0106 family RecB-like putative nuclease [Candidatus Viridilinea halotolerans]
MKPKPITATTLVWLQRCARRIWLDRHGDAAQRVATDPVLQHQIARGHAHEEAIVAAQFAQRHPLVATAWPELVAETLAAMQSGVPALHQGALEVQAHDDMILCGSPDLLFRVEQPSQLGAWSYAPVEIKLHREPRPDDQLQLAFYRWMLGMLQGNVPEGELWLGFDAATHQPLQKVRQTKPPHVQPWLDLLTTVRTGDEAPINFSRQCSYCHWRNACEQEATQRQDIALLGQLDRRTAAALRKAGLTNLAALVQLTAEQLAAYPHVGPKRAVQLLSHAHALLRGAPYPHSAAAMRLPPAALFLDIESHPVTQMPWAFGWMDASGQRGSFVVVPQRPRQAPARLDIAGSSVSFVPDAAAGWQALAALVAAQEGVIIHWGHYERQMLQQDATPSVQDALSERMIDLQRKITQAYSFPIARGAGNGATTLKAIGGYLGYTWPAAANWAAAWDAYHQWCQQLATVRTQQQPWADAIDTTLADGLAYLMSDVVALHGVWQWLQNNAAA